MESSRQIEERAAAWLLKRDGGAWSGEDQAQLAQWLQAATVNRVAFLRLEAGWEAANRLKALGAGFPRGRMPLEGELAEDPARAMAARAVVAPGGRRWPKLLSLAAALSLIAAGLFAYIERPFGGEGYATPIGGLASVPLKDGSNVTLNTASKIRVQMSGEERRIDLAQGEAFFDVARDSTRPFVVHAGRKRIVAVGTRFSVRRNGEDIQVVVTEGIVRLEDPASEGARLTAGAVARTHQSRMSVERKSVQDAEESLSWRSGYVVFHETTLAEAVAEFNRYSERRIVIQDAAVAAIRLTGKFRATNHETFVRLLEDTFQIRTRHSSDGIELTAR